MTTAMKSGGRRVDLLLPFKHGTKTIRSIVLGPMTWDHSLRWQAGEFDNSLALLFSLANYPEEVIRSLRYPDVDRVMENFFAIIPQTIREQIANDEIPHKMVLPLPEEPAEVLQETSQEERQEEPAPIHDPYRMPSREEIEADMLSHPVPPGGFDKAPPKSDNGLGFDLG